ncbi:MAG: response regulator [Chloroflexi bacterium]|nr:response regulator [Chloroflexota bacterium]
MTRNKAPRILLVAYAADVLERLGQGLLSRLGYAVDTVHSVQEAITEFGRRPYDLVLVDTHLPDLSGRDLLVPLQALGLQQMPVVLLARRGEERDIVQALRLGATDFIVWPTTDAEVVSIVRRALERARLQAAYQDVLARVKTARKEARTLEHRLQVLEQLARITMETDRRSNLLPRFLPLVLQLTQAQRGWISLRQDDAQGEPTLWLVSYYNLPTALVNDAAQRPWDDGLSQLVLLSGEPLHIERPALDKFPIRTLGSVALLVPLKWKNRTTGVMGLMRRQQRSFQPIEQQFALIAAGLLSGHFRRGMTKSAS